MARKCSINQQLVELPQNLNGEERPKAPVTMRRIEFLKSLECPVCFEQIFRPVKDCCNGHHVCSICLQKITICPQCKEPAGVMQNRFAEEFLDKYIQRCGNQVSGCGQFYWKEEENVLKEHEESCKFRKLKCWIPNCGREGFKDFMFEHWKVTHGIENSGKDGVTHCFVLGESSPEYNNFAFRLEHDGHTFLTVFELLGNKDPQMLSYTYGYDCTPDVLPMYEVAIKVKVSWECFEELMTNTHQWTGPICNDMESPQEIQKNKRDWFQKLPSIDARNSPNPQLNCSLIIQIIPKIKTDRGIPST